MLVPSNKVGKAMGIYGTMQAISMAIVGKVAISITAVWGERIAFVVSVPVPLSPSLSQAICDR